MPGPDVLMQDDDIDVAGIFAALKRKWWLILLVTLIAGACLAVVLSIISPRYESTARILVRDGNTAFTRTTGDANSQQNGPRFDEQAVRSEVEVVRSNKLLLEVIDDLRLAELEEFEGSRKYSDVRNRVLELAGQENRINPPRRSTAEEEARNQALRILKEKLEVYSIEKSRVIVIEFWSHNPELAQTIVSMISEKYIKKKRNAGIAEGENATIWLDPRIAELENEVLKTDAAVAEFRSTSDILRTDNNNALLATQQLSQVSTELSRLKAERSSAQAKVASIRAALKSGSSVDVIPEVIESPLIQRLREREVELRARISDLSTTLLPNHPRMKALNSQLKDFESQIRTAAKNIVTSLENNVGLTRGTEEDLEKEIVRLKAEAARVDEKLVELRALEREAEAAKVLLTEYKSRSLEAKTRSGLAQVDAEIISPASMPDEPFFPKIIPFTIAGTVAAMVLTTLAIIAVNLLSAVSQSHEVSSRSSHAARSRDVEPTLEDSTNEHEGQEPIENDEIAPRERTHFKELEAILNKSRKRQGLSNDRAGSENSNFEFNPIAIRHAVKVVGDLNNARISVVSPGGDLGSSTSWLLARGLDSAGKSVVLIDLSGGNVCARKMLGTADLPGIFNLLAGSVTVDAVLHKDRRSNVNVVPAGSHFAGDPHPEMDMLHEVISAMEQSFDYCIIDCGDADVSDVEIVSDDDTIVVISCLKADPTQVEMLQADLKFSDFEEVLLLSPDKEDVAGAKEAA